MDWKVRMSSCGETMGRSDETGGASAILQAGSGKSHRRDTKRKRDGLLAPLISLHIYISLDLGPFFIWGYDRNTRKQRTHLLEQRATNTPNASQLDRDAFFGSSLFLIYVL